MKRITLPLFLLFLTVSFGQEQDYFLNLELSSAFSTSDSLSFWQTSEQYGGIPDQNYGMVKIDLGKEFKYQSKWDWGFGAEGSAYTGMNQKAFMNQYFVKGRYKGWILQVGAENIEEKYNGLSSSNGNIVFSTNARALPGIMLRTDDFLQVFKNSPNFEAKAWYGEFLLNDPRSTEGARLHQAGFELKFAAKQKTSFVIGMHDYAQWGGVSPRYGDMNYGVEEYLRMVMMLPGGSEASESDQLNVSGNHVGQYSLRIEHKGDKLNWTGYISHIFEDGSGMGFQNWPDNLYGVYVNFKKSEAIVESLNYEITYTGNMSGSYDGENGGGRDNYFNNGAYFSGWSYYGKSIGTPYMLFDIDENGESQGVKYGYNRLFATNIGLNGTMFNKLPYQFKGSYVNYLGWIGDEFEVRPYNLSLLFETNLNNILIVDHLNLSLGLSSDLGTVYKSNFGGYFKLRYKLFH
ncbi:MAG: hypothetical protein ACPGR7_10345 [Flavobacteriaceae bacterium]